MRQSQRRTRRRAVIASLLAALGTLIVAPSATASDGPAALAEFYQQHLTWTPCPAIPQQQCAPIVVPLDYRNPDGERITVTMSRLPARDQSQRRGVLLLNPGGPGGSGINEPFFFAGRPFAEVYDLIGFDPRGVGLSTPVTCEVIPGNVAALPSRPTEAELLTYTNLARNTEDGCQRAGGGLRPYINTPNTARDMDVMRATLGEKQINYLGFSYGTYLGAVYGSLFPAGLNLSVLDSAVHPDWVWRRGFQEQAVAFRESVDDLATWLGERDMTYGLGKSHDGVISAIEGIAEKLHQKPLENGALDRSFFDGYLGVNARFRAMWDGLGRTLVLLRAAAEGSVPVDSPEVADMIKASKLLYDRGLAETTEGAFDAVTCESDWPRDLETYYRDMRLFRERYPYGFGVFRTAPFSCTFRDFTPPDQLTRLSRQYPTGLVVQGEKDGQTPYAGGPALAAVLRDNLVSVADEGKHGQYITNTCVQQIVDRYLIDRILPASRVTCAGEPRPDVPPDSASPGTPVARQGKIHSGGLERAVAQYIHDNRLG